MESPEDHAANPVHQSGLGGVVDLDGLAEPSTGRHLPQFRQATHRLLGLGRDCFRPTAATVKDLLQQAQTIDGGEIAQHSVVGEPTVTRHGW